MEKFVSQIIAFAGSSGAGKTTIAKTLVERHQEMTISISATTRAKRPNEIDGIDYHFLTTEQFQDNITNGLFLE